MSIISTSSATLGAAAASAGIGLCNCGFAALARGDGAAEGLLYGTYGRFSNVETGHNG